MFTFLPFLTLSIRNITIARENEKSPYKIVIPYRSNGNLINASYMESANIFNDFVFNITGVKLDVVKDNEPLPDKAVLLGLTKYSKQICPNLRTFDNLDDAFHMVVSNDYLLINGDHRATLYGIYELFERFANVRFYATWMLVCPKAHTIEIPSDLDIYLKGSLYFRESYDPDIYNDYLWLTYNRYDSGGKWVPWKYGGPKFYGGMEHTIYGLMKGDEFPMSKYPERYALIKEGQPWRSNFDPCLSNEDVYQTVLNTVLTEIEGRKKEHNFIEVSQMDSSRNCRCPECLKKLEKYGEYSGLYIEFLNRLEKDIYPKHPNVLLRTLAYGPTRNPPKNIKAHPNIIIRPCEYYTDHAVALEDSNYSSSVIFVQSLKNWSKVCDKMIIWMYPLNYIRHELIHPSWFAIGKDLKTYYKYGAWGSFYDYSAFYGTPRVFNDLEKLKVYIHSKLSWNINLDLDDVINDFLRGYFGPSAAPYIRQYMDDAYTESKLWPNPPLRIDDINNDHVYGPQRTTFLEHGFKLWRKAIEASEKDKNIDPRYVYNTETGAVSHYMSIYRYHKLYNLPAKWTLTSIKNQPTVEMAEVARSIPEYCPSHYAPDPRSNRICYLGRYANKTHLINGENLIYPEENRDIYARSYFKFITDEATPNVMTCGQSTFASKEGFYSGRGGILQYNNWNYLEYNMGGFDFNMMESTKDGFTRFTGYHLNQTQTGEFTKIEDQHYVFHSKNYSITKIYTAAEGNGVTGDFKIILRKAPNTNSFNTVVTVACKLDDIGTSAVVQRGDKWDKYTLYDEQQASLFGFKDNALTFNIASPATKRCMNFKLSREPESVSVEVNRSSKAYTVYICFRETGDNILSSAGKVTITPSDNFVIPDSISEQKNEIYPYISLDVQDFSFNDTVDGGKFKAYAGGDEKARTGRALIAENIGINKINTWTSPRYHTFEIPNHFNNYVHQGDVYNFSIHVRCDIKDPNEDAFYAYTTTHYHWKEWGPGKLKNDGEYTWVSFISESSKGNMYFHIHPLNGSSRCYIDELRAQLVTPSADYVPARVPKFTIKELSPMPPVKLYKYHIIPPKPPKPYVPSHKHVQKHIYRNYLFSIGGLFFLY